MSIKATFEHHSIQPDGVHIFAVSEDGQEIEVVVPRADAVAFGWIAEKQQRELAKLAAWNRLTQEEK